MSDIEIEVKPSQPANADAAPEEPKKKREKKDEQKKTFKQELLEWVVTLLVALVVAFVVRSFIFEPVRVDGDSMYPTLHHGEIMYVSKTAYGTSFLGIPFTGIGTYFTVGGEPERFDVVVCNYFGGMNWNGETSYRTDPNGARTNFVKRIVGLPGDTIEIRNGTLYVNGKGYEEKFLHEEMLSDYGPYTVPEGYYFVMGDNRNNSNDSRAIGPITRDMIVGRVESVIWHKIPNTLEDSGKKH